MRDAAADRWGSSTWPAGRRSGPDRTSTAPRIRETGSPSARIYDVASETLGFRRLEQFVGRDVFQLKVMLHALGYHEPDSPAPSIGSSGSLVYDQETMEAVDRFRSDQGWRTTVPGYVDHRTIDRLRELLEEIDRAAEVRDRIRDIVRVRR